MNYHSTQVFPKTDSSNNFEIMCRVVLNYIYKEKGYRFQRYGRSGQTQYGVDIFCDLQDGKRIVAQCKNYIKGDYNKFVSNIVNDIEQARDHFNNIETYVIMTSLDRDYKTQDKIAELKPQCQFKIEVMFWEDIAEELRSAELWFDIPIRETRREVPSYILRRVISCEINNDHSLEFSFLDKKTSLIEALEKDKHIILVGGAGDGKTVELQNLYNDFFDNKEKFAMFLSLSDSSDEKINEILYYAGKIIGGKTPLFIIDGLDEIEPTKRTEFIKKIKTSFPKLLSSDLYTDYVVISSRENFVADFKGFVKYRIAPLSSEDIEKYAENQSADYQLFRRCLIDSHCFSLAQIPFYLKYLLDVYNAKQKLPPRSQLMEDIVDSIMIESIKKYNESAIDIEGVQDEVNKNLAMIAFSMQVQKKYSLSEDDYQELIKKEDRELIKYWGGFAKRKEDNAWKFEHNNFREYLAAKFLIKRSFDEILEIITYDEENKEFRESWANVIGFLVAMLSETDREKLISRLVENARDMLCTIDRDKLSLSEETQLKFFQDIIRESSTEKLPIHCLIDDERKMIQLYQCEGTVLFIAQILETSKDEYEICGCLTALEYIDNFYGNEKVLHNITINYINASENNSNTPNKTVRAIPALFKIHEKDLTLDVVNEIFSLMQNTESRNIAEAFISCLIKTNLVDTFIDYTLIWIDKTERFGVDGVCSDILVEALKNVRECEAVVKVIKHFINNENNHFDNEKIFEHACEKAIKIYKVYNNKKESILNSMIEAFLQIKHHWHYNSACLKQFYDKTDTLKKALEFCFQKESFDCLILDRLLENIAADSTLLDVLEAEWKKSTHDNFIKGYVQRLEDSSEVHVRLSAFAAEHKGGAIEGRVNFDYDKAQREGTQKYFNALFNLDDFKALCDELIEIVGKDSFTGEQLFEIDNEEYLTGIDLRRKRDFIPRDRKDLDKLRIALGRWCGERTITDFFKTDEWEWHSFFEICKILSSNNYLDVNEIQKERLKLSCEKEFDYLLDLPMLNENFYNGMDKVIFIIQKFNFCCDNSRLLKMLYLPNYLFCNPPHIHFGVAVIDYNMALIDFVCERIGRQQDMWNTFKIYLENAPTKLLKLMLLLIVIVARVQTPLILYLKCSDKTT